MARYVVEPRAPLMSAKRRFLVFRKPLANYDRPWVLYRDGRPIGFYATAEEAIAASPEPPALRRHATRMVAHALDPK